MREGSQTKGFYLKTIGRYNLENQFFVKIALRIKDLSPGGLHASFQTKPTLAPC